MKKRLLLLIGLVVIAVGKNALAQEPSPTSGQSNPPHAADTQKTRPKRVHADLSGFELSPKATSSVQVSGGTRGEISGPALYAPRRGKIYTTTPSFYWNATDARNDFKLTIYDSDGNVIYQTTVHGGDFTYPPSASALKPGSTYAWTVQLAGAIIPEPAEPVEFALLTPDERKPIDRALKRILGDSLEEHIKRADVFVSARLWYDSVAAYSALINKYPEDPKLYDRRGEIYDQIPVTRDLADNDARRAGELRQHAKSK